MPWPEGQSGNQGGISEDYRRFYPRLARSKSADQSVIKRVLIRDGLGWCCLFDLHDAPVAEDYVHDFGGSTDGYRIAKKTPQAAQSAHEAVEASSPEHAVSPGKTASDAQTRLTRSADEPTDVGERS
jgi:hypothetical protein